MTTAAKHARAAGPVLAALLALAPCGAGHGSLAEAAAPASPASGSPASGSPASGSSTARPDRGGDRDVDDVPFRRYLRRPVMRCAPSDLDTRVDLLFPRGAVRPADVRTLSIDAGCDARALAGRLEVRVGDRVLWSTPYEARFVHEEVAVPASVRAALRPGDVGEWGIWPERGEPFTASFEVLAWDMSDEIARIARAASRPRMAPSLRRDLLAEAYLERGLLTAAHAEARAVEAADPSDLRCLAIEQEALRLACGTRSASAWRVHVRILSDFADSERDAVFESETFSVRGGC